MLKIIPLAFAAALYPTLLAGVVAILTRPEPKRLLISFLAGGWAMSVTCGLVIVFVLDGVVTTSTRRSASTTVDLIAGGISLVLAAALWQRHRKRPAGHPVRVQRRRPGGDDGQGGDDRSRTARMLGHGSIKAAFVIGMVLNLPGIWYLVALNDIAAADYGPAGVVLLVVIFNAIMFLLAEVPLIGYLVRPDQTTIRVEQFQLWLSDNRQLVAAHVAAVAGVYLISRAVAAIA
ncbi:MAG: GAP family protein [Betaproteobacteria bacterium]